MKKRIVISLLLVCIVFTSGCIEVEYSSSAKLSLFPKKEKVEELRPTIIGYDYPHYLKAIQELKRVEVIEPIEDKKPVRIVFTKFKN